MTQYPVPTDQQFAAALRSMRTRITQLEQRTNALGTSGTGGAAVTVPSLNVVNANGSVTIAVDPALPSPASTSPAVIISDGQGSSALAPQLYSREITSGAGSPYEELIVRGPQSSADPSQSLVLAYLVGAGSGTNAASGALVWEQVLGAALTNNLTWDQWGVTQEQPKAGSAASNTTVVGSSVQNDVPPSGGASPKFVRMGALAGTTDGSGNLAVTGLALGFTPSGVVVTRNGATGPAGVVCKSASGLSSAGFSTYWDNGGVAYASSAVAGWFTVFG